MIYNTKPDPNPCFLSTYMPPAAPPGEGEKGVIDLAT